MPSAPAVLWMLGVAGVALTLTAEVLLRLCRGSTGRLREVLFFPCPAACVERLFAAGRSPCPCPLPHGVETSFSRLLSHLLSARVSVDVCMFAFAHPQLRRALLLLRGRGLAVRVLCDRDYVKVNGSQIGLLRKQGVCVRHDVSAVVHMHHKFAVLDGRTLLTGSLNWTTNAVQNNAENVLVTDEPALVRPYRREFQRLWDAADPDRKCPQQPGPEPPV
ncbi:mitochondrial cardiolipin hydrolase isoform X2 [Denticeps clupeoides]|uniref:mitochondrial cardiolipin hydrolase isoform X2 n=1 Tax=Denticeps clupeoides TaxID=299321 RepID=UPI0010A3D021|nr:mitochondrial cardiolipin hydrolase isoform X2 [Denticeps clupeoides]